MTVRISTASLYDAGSSRISELQAAMMKTQQQLSSGSRILTPADDPLGAARALNITQSQSMNTQYAANRVNGKNALSQEEGTLASVTNLIQDVQTQVVAAGSGTMDDSQRKFIATDLQGRLDQLIGLANTRDGTGNFIFAGFSSSQVPYTTTANGASYNGDQGERLLQVGPSRQMSTGDSGYAVFGNIPAASGSLTTAAASANTGAVTTSAATVTDATAVTGHNYDVVFSNSGATWSVYDATNDPTHAGAALATGAYTSGQVITFDGLRITPTGTAQNGDTLTVRPARTQDLFSTLSNLIAQLNTPAGTSATGKANLTHGLDVASGNLSNALDSVLGIRASVGSRLNEIDALDSNGSDTNLQYTEALSQIQDVDYVKAISTLNAQQLTLQAAQQSFVKLTGLSLFSLL
jgi:flagellar hook-associated protein 3 FlgL